MIRNRLSKWKAVGFKNFENRTFASRSLRVALPAASKLLFLSTNLNNRSNSGSSTSIGFKNEIITNYSRLYSSTTKSKLPPHEVILMPALSPTMTTGNIGAWQKKVGDALETGDVLCEIETDKAQMDFEVQEEGFLAKILIPEGTKDAEVGKPLAIFVTKKEYIEAFDNYDVDASIVDKSTENTSTSTSSNTDTDKNTNESEIISKSSAIDNDASVSVSDNASDSASVSTDYSKNQEKDHIKISPLAKKLAKEKGINLNSLEIKSGSGPNSRIIKNDILSMKDNTQISRNIITGTEMYVDLPLSNVRKVIANRLTDSKQSIPHYYLKIDVEMDKILEIRSKFNSNLLLQESFGSFKLSVNDFIVKATALALKKVPECNSSWQGDFIRQYEKVDVCVAVATPSGLITPIISDADLKGLVEISGLVKELAGRAKINKLKPEEYQGGTFTISNLGMFGIDSFTAIINPPQSCILAVGSTRSAILPIIGKNENILNSNSFRSAQVMSVTLSCDHRVVDGATGAQWLNHFKRFLEDPEQMIL